MCNSVVVVAEKLCSLFVPTCSLLFFHYRDELKRHYNLGQYYLLVSFDDLISFDEDLADKLQKLPAEHLPLVRREPYHVTCSNKTRNKSHGTILRYRVIEMSKAKILSEGLI